MKPPETERLKLKCDDPLSNFAFKFKLRRYIKSAIEKLHVPDDSEDEDL
jgi:hypothetical protein